VIKRASELCSTSSVHLSVQPHQRSETCCAWSCRVETPQVPAVTTPRRHHLKVMRTTSPIKAATAVVRAKMTANRVNPTMGLAPDAIRCPQVKVRHSYTTALAGRKKTHQSAALVCWLGRFHIMTHGAHGLVAASKRGTFHHATVCNHDMERADTLHSSTYIIAAAVC
jgi:hypothetical protein